MIPTRTRHLFAALLLACVGLLSTPLAQAQDAFTNYAENGLTDRLLRAQATPAFPSTWYVALFTTAPTDSTLGTEVAGNAYARASFTPSLTNWSGTQGAGTTVASTGTTGISSNNGVINFTTPTGSWGTVSHWCLMDALTSGNAWICAALTANQTISTGNTVSFAAGAITVTVQ